MNAALRRCLLATVVLASVSSPGQAQGQTILGQVLGNMIAQEASAQRQIDCMRGNAIPDKKVAETRSTAYAAMSGYWQAVRGGGAADATPYFVNDAKVGWTSGDTRLDRAGLTRISDPLATAGATIGAEPSGYVRSGNGSWVWAQWRVTKADGGLVGTYDAMFRRKGGKWLLSQLTAVPANVYLDPVVQFCSVPNDVLPYRLATSQATRDDEVGRADKLKAKADAARAEVDRAVAKGDATEIAQARARADEADKKAAEAARYAKSAISMNERVKAEAAAADARKAAAIAALTN